MTNSAKKMTKDQKETVYQIMAERVCGYYGFSDDLEPTVSVKGSAQLGEYMTADYTWKDNGYHTIYNHIVIRPSQGLDVLAHELAHFVQTMTEGKSRCHEMNDANCHGDKMPEICDRHAVITTEIRKIIDCDMAA